MLELRNQRAFDGSQPAHDNLSCEFGDQAAAAPGLPVGARWRIQQGTRLTLELPASTQPVDFRLLVARTSAAELRAALPTLTADTPDPGIIARGGPPRFPTAVTTTGR